MNVYSSEFYRECMEPPDVYIEENGQDQQTYTLTYVSLQFIIKIDMLPININWKCHKYD